MKKLLVVAFLFISVVKVTAQQPLNDSLIKRIDSLESLLEDRNYTRVPIGDLDKVLNVQVEKQVYDAYEKYLIIFGLIIFGGGFGIYSIMKAELKEQVSKGQEYYYKKNQDKLKELTEAQDRENARQDILIKSLTDNLAIMAERQDNFLSDITSNVDKKISAATSIIWNDIAENKLRKAKEEEYQGGLLIRGISDFINNESVEVSHDTKSRLIDALMRCFYTTSDEDLKKYNFKDNKYKSMINLVKTYESKFELLPETFANAAIAFNNQYEYYRNPEDKLLCIDCCDKSLQKLKDYGIPFVLKIELYIMDYVKAFDEEEKEVSIKEVRRIFHSINENQSPHLHFEAYERLVVDKEASYLTEYIDVLELVCRDEMLKLKEKVIIAILSNWMNDKYKNKILMDLLKESSDQNNQMNGKWKAIKSLNAGVETDLESSGVQIDISDYHYVLYIGGKTDNRGYIFYLPYEGRMAINFYSLNSKNEYRACVHSISKIQDNGNWLLCSNYITSERPTEFSSNGANNYYLDEFIKI